MTLMTMFPYKGSYIKDVRKKRPFLAHPSVESIYAYKRPIVDVFVVFPRHSY